MTNVTGAHLTGAQRWVLGLAAAGSFLVVLDMLVVSTALGAIRAEFGASIEQLEWTVNAYTLSFAVLLMTAAGIGDRFGRRRTFVSGLGLFALASAACALAPDIGWLIAARAVQGVGAAAIMPLALALLNAAFPPERRGWAIGIFGGISGLGVLLGPVVGGVVTQVLSWEWIFWLNVPVAVTAVVLGLRKLPESFGPRAALDGRGVLLVTGGTLGLVWALVRGNAAGWASVEVLASLVVGAGLTVGFVVWELRAPAPMLPMRLFRSAGFSAGSGGIFLLNAAMAGAIFLMAQFLQTVLEQGPLDTGLQLLPWGIAPFLLTPIVGGMIDRIGSRRLVVSGMALATVGMAWIAAIGRPGVAYLALVVPLLIIGSGMAMAIPALTKSVVSAVAPQDLGKASGTFSTMRQLGGTFGVAAVVAVFAATGGYGSAQSFSDGFGPAIATAAALTFASGVAGLVLPGRQRVPENALNPK